MNQWRKRAVLAGLLCVLAFRSVAEDAPPPSPPPDPVAERIRLAQEAMQKNPTVVPKAPVVKPEIAQPLADLGSQDAPVREAGAKAFLKILEEQVKSTKKPYVPKLNEDLASADAAVREAAATTLAGAVQEIRAGSPQIFTAIASKMGSDNAVEANESRAAVVNAIGFLLEGRIVNKLIEELAAPDGASVEATSKKLLAFESGAAPHLVAALEDERLAVKKACGEVLKQLGPAAKDEASDLAFLLDGEDKVARKLAAAVLENLGPDAADAAQDLAALLDNEEKSVRRVAANILKKMGPGAKDAATDLVDLLTEEDKNTRSLAHEVLVGMGPHVSEEADALVEIAADANNEAASREYAANVLAAIGPAAAGSLEALKKIGADPDEKVRAAVAAAIEKIQAKK